MPITYCEPAFAVSPPLLLISIIDYICSNVQHRYFNYWGTDRRLWYVSVTLCSAQAEAAYQTLEALLRPSPVPITPIIYLERKQRYMVPRPCMPGIPTRYSEQDVIRDQLLGPREPVFGLTRMVRKPKRPFSLAPSGDVSWRFIRIMGMLHVCT